MTEGLVQRDWVPLPGSLPPVAESGTLYLLPTRMPAGGALVTAPMYLAENRFFPKEARAEGIRAQFSLDRDSRKFLSEFSADASTWALALALIGPITDWVVLGIELFIRGRGRELGYEDEDAKSQKLKVSIAELDQGSSFVRGLEIEGRGADVLEALRTIIPSDQDS